MPNPGLLSRMLSAETGLGELLERIKTEEPRLHAWTEIRLEEDHQTPGPLKGIPYGAKDIVETKGYTTSYGSSIYAGNVSTEDAVLIQLLRGKGARLMGKTQTTSFAYFDPAPTRNPHDPAYTPGGSSSGSAAAVAKGMVPFAIGTQTQGSIIRPASYCGVTGFKPTFGTLPVEGIMPFAPTLDTPGFFTQNAMDMRLLWGALGFPVEAGLPETYGMIEFEVEPEMQEMFRHAIQILGQLGCVIKRFPPPPAWNAALQAVPLIQTYEGARSMQSRYEQHGNAIGAKLAQLVRDGLAMAESEYQAAISSLNEAKQQMAELFQTFPVMLSAAAPGPPPKGLASTGSPRCNAVWTGLHTPAISIPIPVGEQLPMGLQMSAAPGNDAQLIAAAVHCYALLHSQGETK
ncbi:MAG: amidase [Acidobacteria bacterium]|nr:amidase [Acidobacteriota bacterium]